MKKLETLANIIESILFVSGKAVAVSDISEKLGVSNKEVTRLAKTLQEKYDEASGINLLIFNNKLQFCSNPKYAEDVANVLNPIKERELSRSMLEVAAIVAYKQPVTRLDLEEIRGCNSEYAIQVLLKLKVITVVGHKDAIGKPALFGTTDNFLKRFQISSLDELPDYDDLMSKIKLIHGGDDTYLFRKDVYDAQNDPDYLARQQEADAIAAGQMPGATATAETEGAEETAATETVTGESAESKEEEKTFDYSTIGVSDNGAEGGQEDLFADQENEKDGEEEDELKPVDEEDIPDFLKDEKIERIG